VSWLVSLFTLAPRQPRLELARPNAFDPMPLSTFTRKNGRMPRPRLALPLRRGIRPDGRRGSGSLTCRLPLALQL
jgi:hypothetical protein